jgi:transcriptional regulator GlxA family with amidase domain
MDPRVHKVSLLMRENVTADLSLHEMAARVGLSAIHLTRLFKAELGTTPHRHFKSLKLRKVRELVETTFLSIDQIGEMVGLKSRSHLVQDFKKEFGMTPREHWLYHLSQDNWVKGRGRF